MTPRPGFEDHVITVFRDETREYPGTVNDDGDIIVDELQGEIMHMDQSVLWCDECGRLWPDEYLDHGIAENWSEA